MQVQTLQHSTITSMCLWPECAACLVLRDGVLSVLHPHAYAAGECAEVCCTPAQGTLLTTQLMPSHFVPHCAAACPAGTSSPRLHGLLLHGLVPSAPRSSSRSPSPAPASAHKVEMAEADSAAGNQDAGSPAAAGGRMLLE